MAGRWLPLLLVLCAACASARDAPMPSAPAPATEPEGRGFDSHVHLFAEGERAATTGEVLTALSEAGLARGALLSSGHHRPPTAGESQREYTARMNDWTMAQARAHPGALLAFCSVPVREPWAEEEIARCAAGARGLKLHTVSEGVWLKEPAVAERFAAVLRASAQAGLPVLIHVEASDPDEVRALFALVAAEPDATVIAAHGLAQQVALLSEAPANLWLEISGITHAPAEAGAFFVPAWRAFGIERVLLGSDWPYLSPRAHVALLEQYPLTPEERHAIVHGNAARLFPEGERALSPPSL